MPVSSIQTGEQGINLEAGSVWGGRVGRVRETESKNGAFREREGHVPRNVSKQSPDVAASGRSECIRTSAHIKA